ncbi:Dynein light chain 4, axonemal [Dissostichus eleginoides]|nr:Dynein light chain 4, axonemal [Dissostichus eleginoides]
MGMKLCGKTGEVFGGETPRVGMAGTGEAKKEEADYKRLHSFPLIRHTDMPEEMRVETMELCVTACEKFATNNESAAKMIKESMDKKFGSSWHVVIGEGFGFEVTHERFYRAERCPLQTD